MIPFKHEHAALNWANQNNRRIQRRRDGHQKKWLNKRVEVIKLKSETPEGARWGVKELED